MALKYPVYSHEQFRCIANPLAAAKVVKAVHTIEARKKRHENALQVLQGGLKDHNVAFVVTELFGDMLKSHCQHDKLTPEQRRFELSKLYRNLERHAQFPAAHGDRRLLAFALLGLYGQFRSEDFVGDVIAVSDQSGADVSDTISEIEREKSEVQRAERDLRHAWEDAREVFSDIPVLWDDDVPRQVPESEREAIQARNVERILRKFASEWKQRAPLFAVPVTVAGIAISSLPAAKRQQWGEAYDLLQLEKIPKRHYFHAVEYQKSEAEKAAELREREEAKTGGILARVFG